MKNNAGVQLGQTNFRTMPLGAGGFATGFTFANSGAMVHQEDVYGGYWRASSGGPWVQMFHANSLPAGHFGENRPDYTGDPAHGITAYTDNADGCYAAAIAPTNDAVVYATYNGRWYVCTNAGVGNDARGVPYFTGTWTLLGGPYVMMANSVPNHYYCRRSIVDPVNPAVAMLGPMGQDGKIVYTTNGTSGSPTPNVLTVPIGTNNYPVTPAVDPTSASGGSCQTWAYFIPGKGIYESTTGIGGTYNLLSGSPTSVSDMKYDAAGNLWACTNTAAPAGSTAAISLYKKPNGGSMAMVTGVPNQAWLTIAIDPQNTNSIVLMAAGAKTARSLTGGSTWVASGSGSGTVWTNSNPKPYGISVFPTSLKWTAAQRGKGFAPSEINFHPTNGTLDASCGIGFFRSTPPTTVVEWMWTEDSLGIESLEVDYILKPPGGPAIVCVHDRGFFTLTDEHRYASAQQFPGGGIALQHGWHADYVPGNPSHIVGCCSFSSNAHGKSNNYGLPGTWSLFTGNHPDGVIIYGGCIVAASDVDYYWFPGQENRAVETHDGGAHWSYIAEFPLPTVGKAETGFGSAMWNFGRPADSDKVTKDVYCWNYGPKNLYSLRGVWKRTFGSSTFTQICTDIGTGFGPGSYHTRIRCVPGFSSDLFIKGDNDGPLFRSTDYGAHWSAVTGTDNVMCFGFGKPATVGGYPTVAFFGDLNGVRGVYRSDDNCATWITLALYPNNFAGKFNTIEGDPDTFGKFYLAASHNGGQIGEYEYDLSVS